MIGLFDKLKEMLDVGLPPADIYKAIRGKNPEPFGDHWEFYGAHLTRGVWADPEYLGIRGEYDLVYYRPDVRSRMTSTSLPTNRPGKPPTSA